MGAPELFQFHFSHFNEKARWALDYKGVEHVRHSLLPGPHGFRMAPMTRQTQVPALRVDGEWVLGSDRIIDYLERHHPKPPLYPTDPKQRARALEIQAWFDENAGPGLRLALFHELMPAGDYLARLASQGRSALQQWLYRVSFPAVRTLIRFDLKITEERAARGREQGREALDFVVKHAGPEGYLVGHRFSVADLAAASLLLLTVFPPELQFRMPEPHAPALTRWLGYWEGHPGTAWVREMYRRHRGQSAELTA